MKEFKIQIIEKLEENAKEVNAVLLRKAAIELRFLAQTKAYLTQTVNGLTKCTKTEKLSNIKRRVTGRKPG